MSFNIGPGWSIGSGWAIQPAGGGGGGTTTYTSNSQGPGGSYNTSTLFSGTTLVITGASFSSAMGTALAALPPGSTITAVGSGGTTVMTTTGSFSFSGSWGASVTVVSGSGTSFNTSITF